MKRYLLFTLVALILIVGGSIAFILWYPNSFEGDRFVTVSKGQNFSQVADSLKRAGVIRNTFSFQAAGRILGLTTRMQIGRYRFRPGMSNAEILEDLRHGRTTETILVVIPEGLSAVRQARLLSHRLGIDSARFVSLVDDSGFARTLGVPSISLEGYLLPGAYRMDWQEDEEAIVKEMVGAFWLFFNDSLRAIAGQRGYNVDEVVTMASIVEGETSIDTERAIIAGVYYNRLKRHMRLEADPTIEYILPDGPRPLRLTDLDRPSPYNTYRNYGLPPAPINNPGKASLLAALSPRKHRYLFFVAKGDGGHQFSLTYDQHLRAIRKLHNVRTFRKLVKEEGVFW